MENFIITQAALVNATFLIDKRLKTLALARLYSYIKAKVSYEETMSDPVWNDCRDCIKEKIPSGEFDLWINPLQAKTEQGKLALYAPNQFVLEHINNHYLNTIRQTLASLQCPLDPVLKKGSINEPP